LRLARERQPDVITLDILLPGADGGQVLAALKADEAVLAIPVVIISIVADQGRCWPGVPPMCYRSPWTA
jgi:CheY-like chemotaxis protein